MLILYLAVLITAVYWVVKTLAPEMAKPPLPKITPVPKTFKLTQDNDTGLRIEKLELLLVEKNKNIQLLQTELKVFHSQLRDFDKLKTLLEEEIHRLREQNRVFRSELGLPAVVLKENSIA